MARKIKVDYLIVGIFLMMAVLSVLGRITIVRRVEKNYKQHLVKLENNFRDVYLSVNLRNFSYGLNTYSSYELLNDESEEIKQLEFYRKNYFETITKLKSSSLLQSPEDQSLLNSLYSVQMEKLNSLKELRNKNKNKTIKSSALSNPKIQKLNVMLRNDLDSLIGKEVLEYRLLKQSLSENHNQVVAGNYVISFLLFISTLCSAFFIFKYARNLRVAHQETLDAIKAREDVLSEISQQFKIPQPFKDANPHSLPAGK